MCRCVYVGMSLHCCSNCIVLNGCRNFKLGFPWTFLNLLCARICFKISCSLLSISDKWHRINSVLLIYKCRQFSCMCKRFPAKLSSPVKPHISASISCLQIHLCLCLTLLTSMHETTSFPSVRILKKQCHNYSFSTKNTRKASVLRCTCCTLWSDFSNSQILLSVLASGIQYCCD